LAICRTAGVVHFLCHCIFQPDRRPETGLLLWPRTIPDGLLSIESLGREHFKNLQHATLVACWGADNFVRPGRRIVSLPQVLQRAGAESVLGCFWPVELSAGSRLASRFYEHARRLPRDKALRQAVLDVITDKNRASDTASPVFWAGFQLHGDPGRLRW
jgi:CHAT domain-containing protein